MNFKEYQEKTALTAIYPKGVLGFIYCALALGGESGEIQEKVKKIIRDKAGMVSPTDVEEIKKELGDVLWYISQLSSELGISLDDVATTNIEKLSKRKSDGKIHGSGDNR